MINSKRKILAELSLEKEGDWDAMYEIIRTKSKDIDVQSINNVDEKLSTPYLTIVDDEYPLSFKKGMIKPPIVLYYKGNIGLLNNKTLRRLSVVGSRKCTKYGCEAVRKVISGLSKDYIVISGLAYGIDAIAHRTAIDNGLKTIAVLGSGIDYIYPKENAQLYHDIIKSGGLIISEYPNNTKPKKPNFIERNRIVASLGNFLLVGEAYEHSGTSTTVMHALNYGNNVGCIPYPSLWNSSCNKYIKEGAYLIETADDIETIMNDEGVSY